MDDVPPLDGELQRIYGYWISFYLSIIHSYPASAIMI
ncbi:Uncharacterised protein [Klebsiella oxytoca]|nr:Uncharacterised protein [Klebsiella oxytoca]